MTSTSGDVKPLHEPEPVGVRLLAPGLSVLTLPPAQGVWDYRARALPMAALIYARRPRRLAAPLAPEIPGDRIAARSVVAVPPGLETRWTYPEPVWDDGRRLQSVHLRLGPEIEEALGFAPRLGALRPELRAQAAGLAHAMARTADAYAAPAAFRGVALQEAALLAAARALDPEGRRGSGAAASLTSRRRRALRAYVEDNLCAEVSVPGMAAAVGLSPWHFMRAFRAATGETPYAWVTRLRIERVKAELLSGRAPLDEIARRCGFATQSRMTEVFRRKVGAPPGRWRRLAGATPPRAGGPDATAEQD
jgi:AraC-like DNA-binding protein